MVKVENKENKKLRKNPAQLRYLKDISSPSFNLGTNIPRVLYNIQRPGILYYKHFTFTFYIVKPIIQVTAYTESTIHLPFIYHHFYLPTVVTYITATLFKVVGTFSVLLCYVFVSNNHYQPQQ